VAAALSDRTPVFSAVRDGHQFAFDGSETILEVSKLVGNPKKRIVSGKKASSSSDCNHVLPSGEHTKYSGIYEIEDHSHHTHRIEKEIFIRKGVKLPFCSQCASSLSFRLMQKVEHINEDPDFT
jgi:hypothetical protein